MVPAYLPKSKVYDGKLAECTFRYEFLDKLALSPSRSALRAVLSHHTGLSSFPPRLGLI